MQRRELVLGVFLLASLAANALLLFRASSPPEGPSPSRLERTPRTGAGSPPGSPSEEEWLRLRRELEATREKVESLEKDQRAQATGRAVPETPDRVSQFRERLRQLGHGRTGQSSEPREMLAQQELRAECERLQIYRLEDPGSYGKCLAAYYDFLIGGMTPACTENQKALVEQILTEAAMKFSKISEETSGERLLSELRLEGEVHGKLADLLGQPFQSQFGANTASTLFEVASTRGYLGIPTAGQTVALQWASGLGIDRSQFPAVEKIAAEFMEDAWARQCRASAGGTAIYGTRESFSLREQALQSQLEALRRLSTYLTPDQQARLKSFQMREYLFFKPSDDDEK